MDYEKKYKEALERAKKGECLESIFPELKESKISKEIIKHLISFNNGCYKQPSEDTIDNWVAWLEKQGEQRPTNKVEPKFKVGDWIVNNYCIGKVIALTDDAYLLDSRQSISFPYEDKTHLWTIQDAKDGDVLMANAPFIFNGNLEDGIGCPGAYCGINTLGKFQIPKDKKHWTGHTTTPANKEQREQLFNAMYEAGYEWDADNKELKKIDSKVDSYMSDREKAYEIAWETSKHYDPNGCKQEWCEMAAMDIACWKNRQKLAWNENDEKKIRDVIRLIEQGATVQSIRDHYTNWLKSLKDRIQLRQE